MVYRSKMWHYPAGHDWREYRSCVVRAEIQNAINDVRNTKAVRVIRSVIYPDEGHCWRCGNSELVSTYDKALRRYYVWCLDCGRTWYQRCRPGKFEMID